MEDKSIKWNAIILGFIVGLVVGVLIQRFVF